MIMPSTTCDDAMLMTAPHGTNKRLWHKNAQVTVQKICTAYNASICHWQ